MAEVTMCHLWFVKILEFPQTTPGKSPWCSPVVATDVSPLVQELNNILGQLSTWKKWRCTKRFSQFLTFYYCCTIYTSTYNFECINFHIIFLFVRMNVWCRNSNGKTWDENINCSCHGCKLRNYYFSTWPKRQDYRFTQPRTCNLLSHKRKKNRTKWHTTLLKCLFLLRFDNCVM